MAAARKRARETDNQRLDRAFGVLREAGVVALQKAGDTMSDGQTMVEEQKDDDDHGYCFFHRQDIDRCKESGNLYIAFGGFQNPGRARKATDGEVGAEVRDRLKEAGLRAHWNGRTTERICVDSFNWNPRHRAAQSRRSRPTAPARAGAESGDLPFWNRLERLAAKIAPEVVGLLNKGCSESQIAEVEEALGVRFPDDYRATLRVHNGQKVTNYALPSVFGGWWQFLPVGQVLEQWQTKWHRWEWDTAARAGKQVRVKVGAKTNDRGIKPVDYNLRWIPVVGSVGMPDFYCLDLDPGKGGVSGQIILVEMNLIHDAHKKNRNRLVARSFAAFVDSIADRLERRQFKRATEKLAKGTYRAYTLHERP